MVYQTREFIDSREGFTQSEQDEYNAYIDGLALDDYDDDDDLWDDIDTECEWDDE